MSPVFHTGELDAQSIAGTRGVAEELAYGLSTHLKSPDALNALFSNVHLLAVASVARDETTHCVWVSIIFGAEFIHATSPNTITVHLDGLHASDVLFPNLRTSAAVGSLGIDFAARRRFRFNGNASIRSDANRMRLDVDIKEAFPNCPKYIQTRSVTAETAHLSPLAAQVVWRDSTTLSADDKQIITRSDLFFLGTFNASTGADANHRGGRPGFVRVVDDSHIFWGDYRGNGMFQSFGNLQVDDRAGVTFVDFDTGRTVQLSGSAVVQWDDVDPNVDIESGAIRVVKFQIDKVRSSTGPATNFRWTTPGYSPYNPLLADEEDTNSNDSGFPIKVRLVKIVTESAVVKTLRFLSPRKVTFLPGQYATFDFGALRKLTGSAEPVVRTWTLSEVANSTRGDVTLEVSVKRKKDGLMSNWLHDHATIGLQASLLGIGGHMTPFDGAMPRKLLLISGGIGITPNMAIVRGIGARLDRARDAVPDVVFVHQERDLAHMPFQNELRRRARTSDGALRVVALASRAGAVDDDTDASWRSRRGRVDAGVLARIDAIQERVVYVCGPAAFMESVSRDVAALGVDDGQIVTEEFNF